jgi:hypothetical protein
LDVGEEPAICGGFDWLKNWGGEFPRELLDLAETTIRELNLRLKKRKCVVSLIRVRGPRLGWNSWI